LSVTLKLNVTFWKAKMIKGKDRAINSKASIIPDEWTAGEHQPRPKTWFDWPKPYALTMEAWDAWHEEMKKKYPVRYFLYENVDRFFHWIKFRIGRAKWWVLHRFHPKHRYHIVKTRLTPGYYDPDILIFESAFALLCEFVEKNTKWNRIDWEGDDHHSAAWKEMNELVDWYKNVRPHREDNFYKEHKPERPNHDRIFGFLSDDTPEGQQYREFLKLLSKMNDQWHQEDEDQLIRVIKLRSYLWYA